MNRVVRDDVLFSDRIALRDDCGKQMSYLELYRESEILTCCMKARSLVFVLCDHKLETLAFLYETITQNRVPLLLGRDINREFLDKLIQLYQPSYIYCSKEHDLVKEYLVVLEKEFHALLKVNEETISVHPDVAVLISTSGTTGSPKFVKLSYANLFFAAKGAGEHFHIQSGMKGITLLPIQSVYGFSVFLWHWHCGATMLLTEHSVISRQFRELFESEAIEHFAGVSFTYQMLERVQFWNKRICKNLHWAMSGGSQMSEIQQEKMISVLGDKFWIAYGQTESTSAFAGTNFSSNAIKWKTVGKPFENATLCISEYTGELIVEGPCVCMGYALCAADLVKEDVNQGVLYTGDVAHIDEDGDIFLKGRLKRFVKILSKRISLDEVEVFLNNRYPNDTFACCGVDDRIEVYYTVQGKEMFSKEMFSKEIKGLLEQMMKIPAKFVHCYPISEVPRNKTGKIQYSELEGLRC